MRRKLGFVGALLLVPTLLFALAVPAQAEPFAFAYRVDATATLKKLNQTATIKNGRFPGTIDFQNGGKLVGAITLPQTTLTLNLAGIAPVVKATVRIVPVKAVTGTVDITTSPFTVVATSTFYIRIVNAFVPGVPVNLVGNDCITSTAVVVTMRGAANIGETSTFSGPFTVPPLKTCGAATTALNQVIPGPGNTFTATAIPL